MKNYNKHLSFLTNTATQYTFKQVRHLQLIDLFKESAEMVLTQHFIKDHREALATIMFEYEVSDQYKKWSIIKTFQDFLDFTEELQYRYKYNQMKIPITSVQELTVQLHPILLQFFEHFLNQLSTQKDIHQEKEFKRFVGNHLSHQYKQIKPYFQGYLSKRNWGRHNQSGFKKLFTFLASWQRRFFTITKEGVHFTQNENSFDILDNLIFSTTFSFCCGEAAAGYSYGILINSSHRALQLDAEDIFTFGRFAYFLSKAIEENKNIRQNRFNSFARVRNGCESQYFIDGQDYFSSLCDALLAAKKEVFIAGWMLSPFFSLKRPDDKQEYRLDVVLEKIAKAGIKVNIIIYNAPKLALTIDSEFTQKYLTGLSANIRVVMHPNYMLIPFMWSHHEKMVIVDQQVAFMGGLDIGYGRFDSKMHFLTDPDGQFWPGVDYCNYRITDIYAPKDYRTSSIDRKKVPRMPWHDIAVKLMGSSVQDLCRHFIQYWNHVNFQFSMNDRELLMYAGLSTIEFDGHSKSPEKTKKEQRDMLKEKKESVTNSRKAYRHESIEQKDTSFDIDFLKEADENTSPRKKNHTYQYTLSSQPDNQDSFNYNSSNYQLSISRKSSLNHDQEIEFYTAHLQDVSKIQEFFIKYNPKNIINHRYGTSFENVILNQNADYKPKSQKTNLQTHQIVRSESMWAIGLEESQTQHSVMDAYIDLICNAKEYIYIENQFFISEENRVTKCLCYKIIQAHKNKKKFRVIILLPALPGFQGHPANESAAVFRVQVHLILKNIKYMYRKLRKIPNIDYYLSFFSLRTHGVIDGKPVTEIVYIHSKLMIVDDRIALIGSANINDRSLLGNRDTQLAVVIEDQHKEELKIGNEVRLVSKFAHSLRKELYMEHFGLTDSESSDYFNDDVWDSIIEVSKKNHYIYRELFGCYPDDEMTHFHKIREIQEDADPSKYELLAPLIKGQAIPFQKDFLSEEDLSLRPSQKEYFVPSISFT